MSGTDHPTQLHLARVGYDERNQDDQQRHETECQGVQPGATAVPAQAFSAALDAFRLRRCVCWRRIELRLLSLL
jgi:hypothetical protein